MIKNNFIFISAVFTDKKTREQGFTLFEILVSLAILGIAITVIIQLFSASLRSIYTSEGYFYAGLKASEKMREILDDEKLSPGSSTDTKDEKYIFTVDIKKVKDEHSEELPFQLLEVDLDVKWKEGEKTHGISLSSMKLVEKE